jgi:hypothetical protein
MKVCTYTAREIGDSKIEDCLRETICRAEIPGPLMDQLGRLQLAREDRVAALGTSILVPPNTYWPLAKPPFESSFRSWNTLGVLNEGDTDSPIRMVVNAVRAKRGEICFYGCLPAGRKNAMPNLEVALRTLDPRFC